MYKKRSKRLSKQRIIRKIYKKKESKQKWQDQVLFMINVLLISGYAWASRYSEKKELKGIKKNSLNDKI